jgi:hypothetical protein
MRVGALRQRGNERVCTAQVRAHGGSPANQANQAKVPHTRRSRPIRSPLTASLPS